MSDPAAHIRILRDTEPESPRVWWLHGLRLGMGLALIALIAWRLGLAEVGVAITGGALVFLATPSARLRMRNALNATRNEAWVSSLLTHDGSTVLLAIDGDGLAIIEGRAYRPPAIVHPWNTVEEIRFVGPANRPTNVLISGVTDTLLAGRLPSVVFDELAKYGASIPEPSGRHS